MNPSTTWPSLSAYTAGIDCTRKAWLIARVLVDVDLRQHDLAVGGVDHLLDDRPERAARPAPLCPQVDDDGHLLRPLHHLGVERGVGDIDIGHGFEATGRLLDGPGRRLRRDDAPDRRRYRAMGDGRAARRPRHRRGAVTAWLRRARRGCGRPVRVRRDRRWSLQPHVPRDRRRRAPIRPAPAAARPRAGQRPRHGSRAPHHLGAARHGGARRAGPRLLRRRRGDRRAVLRDGLRRRPRRARSRPTAEAVLSTRRRASRPASSLVDTMAAIHAVDLEAAGLADLARHEGYIARQLKRWYGQWNQQKTRELPLVDEVHDALRGRDPRAGPGDHRPRRLPPRQLDRVGATATVDRRARLGDLHARRSAGRRRAAAACTGPVPATSRAPCGAAIDERARGSGTGPSCAERYAEVSGRDVSGLDFYVAFGYWKLACILEGVYARYLGGALGRAPARGAGPLRDPGRRRRRDGAGAPRGSSRQRGTTWLTTASSPTSRSSTHRCWSSC